MPTLRPRLPLASLDCAVLVGGFGTRLRGVVDDVPKPLAPIAGRPFLFFLLDRLALRGARSVVLCCGHKAEAVRDAVGSSWLGMPVTCSIESSPLGTGGAVALARSRLASEPVVVLNGDTWFEPDWNGLLAASDGVGACLALAECTDASRYGSVALHGRRITGFREKTGDAGLINAGVYIFSQETLGGLPDAPHSLERDIFPALASRGQLAGAGFSSRFLDIGTPADYAAAPAFFESLGIAPNPMFPYRPSMDAAQVKLGTCLIIRDEQGRILLERRADCGWWGLPGGRLDPGEKLIDGALREAKEETGLDVEVTRFVGIFSDPGSRTVRYPDNGDLRHLVDVALEARPKAGTLIVSDESLALEWFHPAELPLAALPPVVEMLRSSLDPDFASAVLS